MGIFGGVVQPMTITVVPDHAASVSIPWPPPRPPIGHLLRVGLNLFMHDLVWFLQHAHGLHAFFRDGEEQRGPSPVLLTQESSSLVLRRCEGVIISSVCEWGGGARHAAHQPVNQTHLSSLCHLAPSQGNSPELLTALARRLSEHNVSLLLSRDAGSLFFSSRQPAFSWPRSLPAPSEDGSRPAPAPEPPGVIPVLALTWPSLTLLPGRAWRLGPVSFLVQVF